MGSVSVMDPSPISAVFEAFQREYDHKVARGCVAIAMDREGRYNFSRCDMTPEQLLAAAELLRDVAMNEIAERGK